MKQNEKKEGKKGVWGKAAFLIALTLLDGELLSVFLPLLLLGGIGWVLMKILRSQTAKPQENEKTTYLKECSVPLSQHRDKGTHHLRHGMERDPWDIPHREIDPWDRPDIDIRKYQRQK